MLRWDGLTVLSLFDGISCGMVALQRAGIPVKRYYASEIDKYAEAVSRKHYPYIIRLGDVQNWRSWEIAQPDLVIGGSPCQNLSLAGDGTGLEGEKSKLFMVFANVISHYRPKFFFFKNVANMKNADAEQISRILGVQPLRICSSLVSAQQRRRYYWSNIPGLTQPEKRNIFLQDILESGYAPRSTARCLTATYGRGVTFERSIKYRQRTQILEPVDKNHGGGKVYHIKDRTLDGGLFCDVPDGYYIARNLLPIECERLQTLPDNYTQYGNFDGKTKEISKTQRYKMLGNGWTVDVIAHLLKNIRGNHV